MRGYTAKEVKEPFEIVFPLKGADLKQARPDEEDIELSPLTSATVLRRRMLQPSARARSQRDLTYIDSQAWVRLSYPRRQAIHRAEVELAQREAGKSHETPSGGGVGSASLGGAEAGTDYQSVPRERMQHTWPPLRRSGRRARTL